MSADSFDERRHALEESFFYKKDQELLEQYRAKLNQDHEKTELAEITGIHDEAVLNELLALKIGPQTIAALALVPLVQIAWADGSVQAQEREAILKAAEKSGVRPGTPARAILETWLEDEPEDDLVQAWHDYVRELCKSLDGGARSALKADLIGRATEVAKSAGGILGVGAISAPEKKVLDDLAKSFG